MAAAADRTSMTHLALDVRLPLTIVPAEAWSDGEVLALSQKNPGLRVERTARGEIRIMSPTGGRTGNRNFILNGRLFAWVEHQGAGLGFDSSTGFALSNRALRSADFAWVSRERWQLLTRDQQEKYPPICPDVVIELRSPSDDLSELREKMVEWVACGATLAVLIDPIEACVQMHRANRPVERLERITELATLVELPGLVLSLRDILTER